MPDNDQRGPLDSWLGQQVRPLPPPPGTFELITRRARRRKLRRLAVTVVSAAAVVAGVVIATPPLLSLNVKPAPVAGSAAGNQSRPAASGGGQPANGSATRIPTPEPSTPASSVPAPAAGPVPPNFQPVSVTFVSATSAWAIGQAGTPGTCANKANPDICTSIAHTSDAGKTWQGGPAPATTGPSGAQGVSGIRFLDGTSGWAFGPELWATHDAGKTWSQVDTHGARVTDLETAGDRAFALWAACSGGASTGFAADCTSYTLMTTTASSDNWTPVGSATTGLSYGGAATSAVLALTSATGYLLGPDGTLYSGPLDGGWQKAGATGCLPGAAQANGLPSGAFLAPVSSSTVAVACEVAGAFLVSTSTDGGSAWVLQPLTAWSAVTAPSGVTSLAATPGGTLTLTTASGIYLLPAGAAQWKQASVANAPAGGFSYVGMTTNDQGVALPADASLHEIWMTFDGGQTWAARTPITPGN
jgi:hypothetical protein